MRYPYDADADASGNILVSQYRYDGVKKFCTIQPQQIVGWKQWNIWKRKR